MPNSIIRDYEWSRKRAEAGHDGHLPRGMSATLPSNGDELPQAVFISGAGAARADGVYRRSDKEKSGAPVYRHAELESFCTIARQPHVNKKTGKTKHGWLLAVEGAPLYGAPTESLVVPHSGWKAFDGEPPVPAVEVHALLAEAFFAAADAAWRSGEEAADRQEWHSAVGAYESGLNALSRSGDRFGEPFERRAALLFSQRARAHAGLRQYRSALRDAVAALELVPGLACAKATAVEAARHLGCKDDQTATELLEVAGSGQILDRGSPLFLTDVERWVDEVARVASTAERWQQPEAEAGVEGDAAGAVDEPVEQAPPVQQVTPEYHRGFMHWINFLRSDPIEEDMFREDWAELFGQKMSALSWKYTARRVQVDTSGCSQTEAVLRLMEAYEQAGQPPGPPLPKPPRCEAELVLRQAQHTVHKVEEELDPALEEKIIRAQMPVAKSLKPLN